MEYKSKITWQLDSPFRRNTLLITPIGQYRLDHINPSKGKRSKKTRRKYKSEDKEATRCLEVPISSIPEVSNYVVVGLNSVLRRLESLSNLSRLRGAKSLQPNNFEGDSNTIVDGSDSSLHFLAIFIVSSSQSAIVEELLPQLIVTASLANPTYPQTRIVRVPKECHNQLCQCLGIPSVSIIGILDGAPLSKGLKEFVIQHVPENKIAWIEEAASVQYLPVRINAIENQVVSVAKRQKRQ
ncbi:putative rna-processing protein [Erysiphe neolycopersici]|uniref:Putative rna-processing protein n=1 Tax=Erysiphe neolycopersici TaxID=212602 RepID=A0A420I126_9PEZI|nr:putative rna-processing protein [Erysiphe neolycopersici]